MTRKRLICLFLAALLLLTLVPVASASVDVYFTMVNSNAPDTLQAGTMPVVRSGNVYVPGSVLRRLGVSSIQESDTLWLTLVSDTSVYIQFDLSAGTATTSAGGSISATPMSRSGGFFFPIGTTGSARGSVASHFGINFQFIQTEPAPTVRLYNTAVGTLSHNAVLRNGELLFDLTARYNAYLGIPSGGGDIGTPPLPPDTPGHTPPGGPTEPEDPTAPLGPVSLSFVGLSQETGALLDALRLTRIPAGFFVTAEDALNHPDLIRRLHGEGHQVGIFLTTDAEAEYHAASEVLFEVARLRTVLVAARTWDVARDAYDLGLVVFESNLRQMPSGATLDRLTGNLLLDNVGGNAHALAALPAVIRGNALRVVSFVSSLA